MKKYREIARKTASLIPSSLPFGEVVRIITASLREQHEDSCQACAESINGLQLYETDKGCLGHVTIDKNKAHQAIANTKAL